MNFIGTLKRLFNNYHFSSLSSFCIYKNFTSLSLSICLSPTSISLLSNYKFMKPQPLLNYETSSNFVKKNNNIFLSCSFQQKLNKGNFAIDAENGFCGMLHCVLFPPCAIESRRRNVKKEKDGSVYTLLLKRVRLNLRAYVANLIQHLPWRVRYSIGVLHLHFFHCVLCA